MRGLSIQILSLRPCKTADGAPREEERPSGGSPCPTPVLTHSGEKPAVGPGSSQVPKQHGELLLEAHVFLKSNGPWDLGE